MKNMISRLGEDCRNCVHVLHIGPLHALRVKLICLHARDPQFTIVADYCSGCMESEWTHKDEGQRDASPKSREK